MKEINLKIEDKVYNDIKSMLMIKKLSDNLFGVLDLSLVKIIETIENNQKELTLKYKKGD